MTWISGNSKSRIQLDDAVYSSIASKEKNLNLFPLSISKMVVDYLEKFPCFGESEWTALFGRVDLAPPLPPGFSDIWNGPCPIYPEKKISETHMLVYIPAKVGGQPFTLEKLEKLAKRFFFKNDIVKNDSVYERIWPFTTPELRIKSIEPCWVLMTKDILPGSRNKSYVEQQEIVAELAKKSPGYEVPGTLEAATCILAQYFQTKTRLFKDFPLTYTRCKENYQDFQTIVGHFARSGLNVSYCRAHADSMFGIAALRKF